MKSRGLSKRKEEVVYLHIASWVGIGIGASHSYGELVFHGKSVRLTRKLTAKQAKEINDNDSFDFPTCRAGQEYSGFDSEEELIKLAVSTYKLHFPEATVLIHGSSSCADPQEILDGPEYFKNAINKLYNRAESIGWYERGGGKMYEISDKFFDFFNKHVVR